MRVECAMLDDNPCSAQNVSSVLRDHSEGLTRSCWAVLPQGVVQQMISKAEDHSVRITKGKGKSPRGVSIVAGAGVAAKTSLE